MAEKATPMAHIAAESYVAACKNFKEQAYGLCGAPIVGTDATGMDVERCEECKRLYEEETGDDAGTLDEPDRHTRLAGDVLRAVPITGVAVRKAKPDGGGPATIDIRWSNLEEVHEFPCDGWELVQGAIPGEAEAPGVFLVYVVGTVLAMELDEVCDVTVGESTTRFVDGKPEEHDEPWYGKDETP